MNENEFEIVVKLRFKTFGNDVKDAERCLTERLVYDANDSAVFGNDSKGHEIQLVRVDFASNPEEVTY